MAIYGENFGFECSLDFLLEQRKGAVFNDTVTA